MWRRILENVKIEKVWFWWIGIAHASDGKTILVTWWVLPWMIVDVKILKKKKDFIQAQAVRIVKSEKWIMNNSKVLEQIRNWKQNIEINNTKVCKHNFIFDTDIFKNNLNSDQQSLNPSIVWCWWCKWQILPYEEQLKLKEEVVKDSFAGCDFFDATYEWIIWCDKVFNYRNKMEFSFWKYIQKNKDWKKEIISNWSLWFHKQWQFSKIVDISDCLIAWEKINQVFNYLKKIFKESKLPVYDNYDHSWFFRHLVIREWFNTWQVLVNLSVATKFFDKNKDKISLWIKLQDKLLQDKFLKENITTFLITENNWLADVVKWQDIKVTPLRGPWYIFEKLNFKNSSNDVSVSFRVSAFSFFQTNTFQAQKLFQTAILMLPKIKGNVLDLYCWAGTIWLSLLKLGIGERLVWVEIVEDAVKDAWINAKINNLENRCEFIADKAENINFEAKNIWLIVVDPPRSWLHNNVIKFLSDFKKESDFKLLYISCNPVTMARDLKMLSVNGFNIKKLKAVDMFPHTHHIEMIGLIE